MNNPTWGGFDDDGDSCYDWDDVVDHGDEDECDLEYPDYEIFEDYASQYDDDPDPYAGTYSEE
jgi:hypothetical protein